MNINEPNSLYEREFHRFTLEYIKVLGICQNDKKEDEINIREIVKEYKIPGIIEDKLEEEENKIIREEEEEISEEEYNEEVKPKKKITKKKNKNESESDSDSDKPKKKVVKKKAESSSDSDSESDKPKKKIVKKKAESSSDSDSDSDIPKKKITKKKADSSSDSDSESEKPKKKITKKKAISESESDSDSDNPKKKVNKKKDKTSSDSDSDSEKPKKTQTKKKESEKEPNKEDSQNKKEILEENKNKPSIHSKGTWNELFIKNLSYSTTKESLKEYFSKYGEVEETKIVYDTKTGRSKGVGFCRFISAESADKAMADASSLSLDNRPLSIKYSNERPAKKVEEKPKIQQFTNPDFEGEKFGIFVGNMNFRTTVDGLKEAFGDCGEIVDIRISLGEDSRPRGFAHIDFASKDAQDKAINKNGLNLDGRQLRVDISENKPPRYKLKLNDNNKEDVNKAMKKGFISKDNKNKVTLFNDEDD